MKKYSFCSKLTIAEISSKIRTLPQISFFSMTNADSFCGDIAKNRIRIGRIPKTMASNISFFCGKIEVSQNITYIVGHFAPPIKLVLFPYLIICGVLITVGNITGLLAGIVGCALLQLIQMLLLSVSTQSKKDIIAFITNNLNSTIMEPYIGGR
jgi:hypothetical protein